jgi:hypothetical protein
VRSSAKSDGRERGSGERERDRTWHQAEREREVSSAIELLGMRESLTRVIEERLDCQRVARECREGTDTGAPTLTPPITPHPRTCRGCGTPQTAAARCPPRAASACSVSRKLMHRPWLRSGGTAQVVQPAAIQSNASAALAPQLSCQDHTPHQPLSLCSQLLYGPTGSAQEPRPACPAQPSSSHSAVQRKKERSYAYRGQA